MKRRGFTLVETLTVLAIVAVIAGIAFPVFAAVKRRGQHSSCAERLHQLGTALYLYANDHEGWVPPATTAEDVYQNVPGIDMAEVKASPAVLRAAMESYVKSEVVWFCPSDPQRGRDVRWLGQRHKRTSYFVYPMTPGQLLVWPPRMQIGREPPTNMPPKSEDVPLVSDAVGLPSHDSEPPFDGDEYARSNHPDDLVNALRHDLSLTRKSAKYWTGSDR